MKSAPPLPIDASLPARSRTLGYLLRELYGSLQRRVYAAAAAAGHPDLRDAHSSVLRHLDPNGSRVADLARRCGLAKQSVTYLVDDLVRLGYLAIRADPLDGRAKQVKLTARGRKLTELLLIESQLAEDEMARLIGTQRLDALRQDLATLADHFDTADVVDAAASGEG
jgi:DNA-binding MarR family transcriptional regulator